MHMHHILIATIEPDQLVTPRSSGDSTVIPLAVGAITLALALAAQHCYLIPHSM